MTVKKYDFVIVGGGIVGVSLAYWLASKGAKKICVVEKEMSVCMGSTPRSAGGIRAQFTNEINIRLQMEAVKFFENFDREFGSHAEFTQAGYLFLISSAELRKGFERGVQLQRKLGLEVQTLTPEEVLKIAPYVNVAGVSFATFCQTDGYADPHGVTHGIWNRCKELGVDFYFDTAITDVDVSPDNRVVAFVGSSKRFEGEKFFNCAGAWSGELAKKAGSNVYVYPLRRMLFFTKELPADMEVFSKPIPMTVDMDSGFYMRKEGNGLLMGMDNDNEKEGFNLTVDWDWLYNIIEAGVKMVPLLERVEIKNGWAGLYDQSPDCSAVIGNVPGFENFYVVSGFSGHGFMQGPIATKLLAELVLDGKSSIDISQLSAERFKNNKLIQELNVI